MATSAQVALRPNNEAPRAVLADRRGTTNIVNRNIDDNNTALLQLQYLRALGVVSAPLGNTIAEQSWGGARG
jgi:hypothetical protein